MKKHLISILAVVSMIALFFGCDNIGYDNVKEEDVSESWVRGVWEVSIETIRITDGTKGTPTVISAGTLDFTSDEACAKAMEMFKSLSVGTCLYQKDNFSEVHYYEKTRKEKNGYIIYIHFRKTSGTGGESSASDSNLAEFLGL